jgi:hypothetical protein
MALLASSWPRREAWIARERELLSGPEVGVLFWFVLFLDLCGLGGSGLSCIVFELLFCSFILIKLLFRVFIAWFKRLQLFHEIFIFLMFSTLNSSLFSLRVNNRN